MVGLVRLRPHLNPQHVTQADAHVDLSDDVLARSPLLQLFSGVEPKYAWFFGAYDMVRRLALTCGSVLFKQLSGFILFRWVVLPY